MSIVPSQNLPETSGPVLPALEVSFACPECEHTSSVDWERLAQGMHCPACNSSFDIFPTRLQKRTKPVEIGFQCPRCLEKSTLPAFQVARGVTCTGCQLELLPGPDQKMHDRQELTRLRSQARKASERQSKFIFWALSPGQLRMLMVGSGLLALVLLGYVGRQLFRTPTLEERAAVFTELCLAGDWEQAERLIENDEYQQSEFLKWRIMNFASLTVALRTSGDTPVIEVSTVDDQADRRVLRVVMTSPLIGHRTHTQIWGNTDGQWLFDSTDTLQNLHAGD